MLFKLVTVFGRIVGLLNKISAQNPFSNIFPLLFIEIISIIAFFYDIFNYITYNFVQVIIKCFKMFFYGPYFNMFEPQAVYQPYTVYLVPNEPIEQKNQINFQTSSIQAQSPKQISTAVMLRQLKKRYKKSKSKFWTEEEDDLLIRLAEEGHHWYDIATKFQGKDYQICKRRYERLIRQNQKWPKKNEQLIKYLCQVEKLSWKQIQKLLPIYTVKQIKERYNNFLEVQIKRAEWTIDEDLRLWQMVREHGKKWVKFTKIFEGRSQLQLKNRYNKLIKPLEKNILQSKKQQREDCSDGEWQCDS